MGIGCCKGKLMHSAYIELTGPKLRFYNFNYIHPPSPSPPPNEIYIYIYSSPPILGTYSLCNGQRLGMLRLTKEKLRVDDAAVARTWSACVLGMAKQGASAAEADVPFSYHFPGIAACSSLGCMCTVNHLGQIFIIFFFQIDCRPECSQTLCP